MYTRYYCARYTTYLLTYLARDVFTGAAEFSLEDEKGKLLRETEGEGRKKKIRETEEKK